MQPVAGRGWGVEVVGEVMILQLSQTEAAARIDADMEAPVS